MRTQFKPTQWFDVKTGEPKWGIKIKKGNSSTWSNVSEEGNPLFFSSLVGAERKIKDLQIRFDSKLTFFPHAGDILVFSDREDFSLPMVGRFDGYEIGSEGYAIGYQAGRHVWGYARKLTEDEQINLGADDWWLN